MSGARQVSGSSRQTYASVTPSCSARSVIDFACPLSILRRQRCARTSALISVLSRLLTCCRSSANSLTNLSALLHLERLLLHVGSLDRQLDDIAVASAKRATE